MIDAGNKNRLDSFKKFDVLIFQVQVPDIWIQFPYQ